jgi:rhodanese-related sulfurtransferase
MQAQREMVRIGIDRPAAAATGGPERWTDDPLGTFETATFADLADVRHHRRVAILDVRRNLEWAASHIDGAVHIPVHELLERIGEVPGGEVWVHCGAGYRASIATSILATHGSRVVAVDDDFDQAAAAGLPLVIDGKDERWDGSCPPDGKSSRSAAPAPDPLGRRGCSPPTGTRCATCPAACAPGRPPDRR